MSEVLTAAADVECKHKGVIVPDGDAVSKVLGVNGSAVLVGGLDGSAVGPLCTQFDDPQKGTKQCRKVSSQTTGASKVLKVAGKPVLLADSAGLTDGAPEQDWSVKSTGQSILKAD